MKKVKLDVLGMTCSACSYRVEKEIKSINGTYNVNVNLLSNSADFEFDTNKTSLQVIINSIKRAGYSAKLHDSSTGVSEEDIYVYNTMKDRTRLIISIIFTLPLFYISIGDMFGFPFLEKITGYENALLFAFTQFLLLLPVVFVNFKYYEKGFKSLCDGVPTMDSLIAIGSASAMLYGVFAIYKIGYGLGHGDEALVERFAKDLYFESAGMILTLITLGKYFESRAKNQTSKAIGRLVKLTPQIATLERNGKESKVLVSTIAVGDTIIVKSGESIPVDGVIISGLASIDESSLTGESFPIQKSNQDNVSAGTILLTGVLRVKAEKVGKDTTISQIIGLVEHATASKAPISKLADRISAFFVPVVIALSIIATVVWLLLGKGLEFSLSIGISMLVISCPCALGLATPTAIMVGIGKSASCGMLIKSAAALQLAHSTDCVILDKTGTITNGKTSLTDIICMGLEESELLQIIASLEKESLHPLALGILEKAEEKGISTLEVSDYTSVSGFGVTGVINGVKYYLGNQKMVYQKARVSIPERVFVKVDNFETQAKTVVFLATQEKFLGLVAVSDTIKESSLKAVSELQSMGVEVHMLTGDNAKTAKSIGKQVGIDTICAGALPQEKEEYISRLKAKGKTVAMVGDGVNDAVALVTADIGIAIGAGTDIAIESADIVLIKSDLLDIVSTIKLSHQVIKNIKENLFWAFFYNIICIPIAAGLLIPLFDLRLNPMIAAAAMSLSSIFVILNALRLNFFKTKFKYDKVTAMDRIEHSLHLKPFIRQKNFVVEGMVSMHCAGVVERKLNSIDGVKATVSLEDKTATLTLTKPISNEKIMRMLEKTSYKIYPKK